ncbi:MAG TPA: FKBP-type peptidyl-prolyl cis-trans isomerase [Puia sp.]|nr:FKBP-type peptidyl-prolyl cis-trans isomerase [Puia sp.]
MKKNKALLFILPVFLFMIACNNQGIKKTKSGLLYKIISDGKGQTAKKGQFLKIRFVQTVHDSVLYNSGDGIPVYPPVDSIGPNYSAGEIFLFLRKGDSAVVIQLVDSIQHKFGQQVQLPPFIKKKDKIILAFKVLDIFPSLEAAREDQAKEYNALKQEKIKQIEDYIASNKINAQKTAKGTYVEVKSVGDGPAVDSGKLVSVLYKGKLFPSGKVFEDHMTPPNNQPIKFVLGRRSVIQGWDDGLKLFKKGGKGTLYVPSFLAYDQQPGPGSKPFENLMFDIEVEDVADAPAPPVRPTPQINMAPKQNKMQTSPGKK